MPRPRGRHGPAPPGKPAPGERAVGGPHATPQVDWQRVQEYCGLGLDDEDIAVALGITLATLRADGGRLAAARARGAVDVRAALRGALVQRARKGDKGAARELEAVHAADSSRASKAALDVLRSYASKSSPAEARAAIAALEPILDRLRRRVAGGRKAVDIDLDAVREYARRGVRSYAQLARLLKVHRQVLIGPEHEMEVREAFEEGRALWAEDVLAESGRVLRGERQWDPMLIFLLKQDPIGMTDRGQTPGASGEIPIEIEGSDARLVKLAQAHQRTAVLDPDPDLVRYLAATPTAWETLRAAVDAGVAGVTQVNRTS